MQAHGSAMCKGIGMSNQTMSILMFVAAYPGKQAGLQAHLLLLVLLLSCATGSARCWLWMYLRYCQAILRPSSGAVTLLLAAAVPALPPVLLLADWASCRARLQVAVDWKGSKATRLIDKSNHTPATDGLA
jgi:hypothetical protein